MATESSPEWDDTRVTSLRQLWAEGHSTAEIGRRLGVSKNAIVGKSHRLDLPARPSPIRQAGSGRPRAARRQPVPKLADIMPMRFIGGSTSNAPTPPTVTPAVAATIARAPLQFGKAPCCWPIGDPGTPSFRFCSALVVLNKPYCEEHCKAAYRKPPPSRERCAA